MSKTVTETKRRDLLLILWAGLSALLCYSLVYALRKPFTAGIYSELLVLGYEYKTIVTVVQIVGYGLLNSGYKDNIRNPPRVPPSFISCSAIVAWLALLPFALLPVPYNIIPMFFNGLENDGGKWRFTSPAHIVFLKHGI